MNEQKKLRFFGIGKIIPFLRPFRKQLLVMVIFGLVSSGTDILLPLFQRYALDHFVVQKTLDTIWVFTVAYFLTYCLAAVVNYISCTLATVIEVQVSREMRQAAFSHLQKLSFSYFNQNSVGYIHARLMSDTSRIGTLVSWTLIDCIWRISYLVGSVAVMLYMNTRLALMVLTIVPLLVVLFTLFQKKLIRVNREIREVNSQITANFNEGITGAKTVKSLGVEEKMEQRFQVDTHTMRQKSVKASRLRGLFAGTMNFASSVAIAIVLWKGGYIAAEEVGLFSVFMSYAQGMMEPLPTHRN